MDHHARLIRNRQAATRNRVGAAAPTRVLFVHYGGDWIRGSESVLLDVLRLLDRDRVVPYVACNQPRLAEAARQLAVESFLVDRPTIRINGRATRIEPVRWLRTVQNLGRLARRLRVGLLYCQNGQPGQVAYYAGKQLGIPCVAHVHSFYDRRDVHLMRLTRVSSLIFVSDAVRQYIAGRARLRGSSHVIHNGVDPNRFRPSTSRRASSEAKRQWSIPEDRIVIGQVGSLIHRKGVDLLLLAAKALLDEGRPVHLVLVGGGPGEPEYHRQAARLGIENHVTFTRDVAAPTVFYREVFDINVLASREEAFGLALIEGAASGLPSIAARTGGMKEIIRDGITGMLFAAADAAGLIACLRQLVDDDNTRLTMGHEARLEVEREFSLDRQVQRISDVIDGFQSR